MVAGLAGIVGPIYPQENAPEMSCRKQQSLLTKDSFWQNQACGRFNCTMTRVITCQRRIQPPHRLHFDEAGTAMHRFNLIHAEHIMPLRAAQPAITTVLLLHSSPIELQLTSRCHITWHEPLQCNVRTSASTAYMMHATLAVLPAHNDVGAVSMMDGTSCGLILNTQSDGRSGWISVRWRL